MSLSTALCRWLGDCPLLDKAPEAEVLQPPKNSWALVRGKGQKTLKTYTDGGRMEQAAFILACRLPLGTQAQQEANLELLEEVKHWIRARGRQGDLPLLDETRFAIDLQVGPGHSTHTGAGEARYETELQLIYYSIH